MINLDSIIEDMFIDFFDTGEKGLQLEEIIGFDPDFKGKLPMDFIQFYSQMNGGKLKLNNVRLIYNGNWLCDIDYINPLSEVKWDWNLFRESEVEFFTNSYHSDSLLPISKTGQAYICMGYGSEKEGKIFWIDITDGEFNNFQFPLIQVADSLLGLLKSLKPYSE